jgi:hypothetical protein
MGRSFQAVCNTCHHHFRANEGGGIHFELLRCSVCGQAKSVPLQAIWDSYLAYLKGVKPLLPEMNGADWRTYPGEPISKEEYHRVVETEAGMCSCGGQFSFKAPPRCPACRSDAIERGKTTIFYD